MADTSDVDDSTAPLIEHLAELRTRLIRSVLAFVVAMVACFTEADPILQFISEPLANVLRARGEDPRLIFTAPQEKFFVLIRISIIAGFALSFPVIAHQLWRFVAPGLYRSERNAFLPFIIASPALFLIGASFAHFVVTPLAMNFFIGFADAIPALASLLAGDGTFEPSAQTEELQTVFLGSVRESLELALKFIDRTISAEAQACMAEALRYTPTNSEVKLSDEIAADVPHGADAVKGLIRFDPTVIEANRSDWVDRWNRTIAQ